MMLLIFLPSEPRVLASTSKRMVLTPSICNTKLSSRSVYKATGKDALSCAKENFPLWWAQLRLLCPGGERLFSGSLCSCCIQSCSFKPWLGAHGCTLSKPTVQLVWMASSPWLQWRFSHLSQQRIWANTFNPLQRGRRVAGPAKSEPTLSSFITAISEVKLLLFHPAVWYVVSEGLGAATVAM